MTKVITMVGIMSGVSLLCYFAGIISGTVTSTLLSMALNPESIQTSPLWLQALAVSTVVVGVLSAVVLRSLNSDFALVFPIASVLFTFGWDFLVVYQSLASFGVVAQSVAALLFGPLMIMYVISVIEWWRGVST